MTRLFLVSVYISRKMRRRLVVVNWLYNDIPLLVHWVPKQANSFYSVLAYCHHLGADVHLSGCAKLEKVMNSKCCGRKQRASFVRHGLQQRDVVGRGVH